MQELPDGDVIELRRTCCRGDCRVWFPVRSFRVAAAGSVSPVRTNQDPIMSEYFYVMASW